MREAAALDEGGKRMQDDTATARGDVVVDTRRCDDDCVVDEDEGGHRSSISDTAGSVRRWTR